LENLRTIIAQKTVEIENSVKKDKEEQIENFILNLQEVLKKLLNNYILNNQKGK